MSEKIKSFTDLIAWKEGHNLVLSIYKTVETFPKMERFILVDQICRASVSITSNIAEGFSRKGSKEKIQFYYIALGSLTELQNQLLIARDLKYINSELFNQIAAQSVTVSKLIVSLIKGAKNLG